MDRIADCARSYTSFVRSGAAGPTVRQTSATGTAWRVGDVVLKPPDVLPGELDWLHE